MSKHIKRFLVLIITTLCVLSLWAVETRVVDTKHFKIIYDERTENAATEVYSFAEKAYDELVSLFGEDPKLYMPIYIEPDEKDYNAYFTSFPYNRIVIYDAPVSSTLDNTENTLYMTFLHELTHAFTFSFKDGIGKTLVSIFGDWANVTVDLHMLLFMQEGISVYTESRDGGGRLNDPFFYTPLLQAKIEGRDISYMDASGGRDIMPYGNMWYVYGGAFTKWMEKRYGERDVAAFYVKNAKNLLSFPQNGYSSTFSNKLWNDWERFFDEIKVPSSYSYPSVITEESRVYTDLCVNNGELYALSSSNEALIKVNDKEEKMFSFYSNSPDMSINDQGEFLLPYVSEEISNVSIYSGSGKRIKKYDGYYDGTFLSSSSLLLASTIDRISYLSVINENDEVEEMITLGRDVTLREFTPTSEGVFFLLSRKGEEKIAYFSNDRNLYLLDTPISLYFHSLSSSSNLLSFSYIEKGEEGSLGRYGEIDIEKMAILLSEKEFYGGIKYPVRDGERIYFVSEFFDHSAISEYEYDSLEVVEKGECTLVPYMVAEDEYSSFDINALSSHYEYTSTMNKGALMPISLTTSTFYKPSESVGFSWYTEDATENVYLWASAGYVPKTDSLFFGASMTISSLSFSFSGDGNASFFNWESDVGLAFSFPLSHSGEVVKVKDIMGWVSKNGDGRFLNYFSLSYENQRKHGMGRYHTLGWGVKGELLNLTPALTLSLTFPGIFHYDPLSSLDYAVPFSLEAKVGLKNTKLTSTFHLLTYEIQKSVRFLSLYLIHLDLYSENTFDWIYREGLSSTYGLGLTTTLSPILGQMSRFQVEIGAGLNYNKETGIEVKLVLGAF